MNILIFKELHVLTVNALVLGGMTLRDAYKQLGDEILKGDFVPNRTVNYTHEGSIGNLCLDEIQAKFDRFSD